MKEIRIQTLSFLGRGSMFNVKEGNTAAFWKNPKGTFMVLLDCGCTTFQQIDKLNLLDGVRSLVVAITHTHTDHIGSLSDLIHYCIFCRPDMEVNIIAYSKTMPSLMKYLDCTGTTFVIKNSTNVKIQPLHDAATIKDGLEYVCEIRFIPDKSHIVPSPLTNVIGTYSCGILMKFKEKTIYYSGDTQRIPYDSLDLDNIDEIYVDCAVRVHSPGSDKPYPHYNLFEMISDMNAYLYPLNQIYTMHLDCDGVIDQCKMFGIKIVELEEDINNDRYIRL